MMGIKIYCASGDELMSLTRDEETGSPFYIIADGNTVRDFKLEKTTLEDIESKYGKGKRLTAVGRSAESNIEIELNIELYEDYPDAAFMRAAYINTGENDILIGKSWCNSFILDESLVNAPDELKGFWSFQGASYKWQQDFIFKLPADFSRDNYFGMNDVETGGGLPIIDIWSNKCGIAIGHVEPAPVPVWMPVNVRDDTSVDVSLYEKPEKIIKPGEEYETINSVIIVHTLDYFDALERYGTIMKKNMPEYKTPPELAYKTEWCTWGFRQDFTVDEIYNILPRIKELRFSSVIIDDGWFPRYGDWVPVRSKFPGGDRDMEKFIRKIHEQGLKVWLWWTPFAAVEGGETAGSHPDWLIHDKDGNIHPSYDLCPAYFPVQKYHEDLVRKFVEKWDIDGFKLDFARINAAPPCFNKKHAHASPWNSAEHVPDIFSIIYETAVSLKPDFLIEYCACGIPPSIYQFPWFHLPVTSDPAIRQVTRRIKMYKALFSPSAPVLEEYCGVLKGPIYELTLGSGGVPGTFSNDLNDYHEKWLNIYYDTMLSRGEYLNLYDTGFDFPEGHAIKKDGAMYYAFYTNPWTAKDGKGVGTKGISGEFGDGTYSGTLHLRGLDKSGTYSIFDYEHSIDLGRVKGTEPYLNVAFDTCLLIKAVPE